MPPTRRIPALLLACLCLADGATAQHPAPVVETVDLARPPAWLERGTGLLEVEDPMAAWRVFQDARADGAQHLERDLGLGRAHLMLGRADYATAYGEAAVAAAPGRQDAMALSVRALIRARRFDEAVRRSRAYLARSERPTVDLLAARGSALFRVQRPGDAAAAYRRVVGLDLGHAEAHLRLGSGLLDPVVVQIPRKLRLAVGAIAAGERARAIELLQRLLLEHPGHPIVHRLLGEALYAERTARSMAMQDEAFRRLAATMPKPDVRELRIAEFVPAYRGLARARREVIERTAALFRSRLDKLIRVGGRHDLLAELERTTDADARKNLRGSRTFDGRVWDDVRGIGGLRAATGIEALDEAATFGFDTFAHEVAHQVHFFTFNPLERARIRSLYKQAMAERRCLDYYAASNEAEYFGQGVEAFVSLAKRPGSETTHGHTRWELLRVDPKLYAFLVSLVDFDPLLDGAARQRLLAASVEVALRCGRPEDAAVAAEMMNPGEQRTRWLAGAARVQKEMRSH
ncbi:MAG: tetratricopeptide repeat protein [Planctomycetota bacterium]